ncbi:MAG: NADH:ubiquinone reductase (Na(+)-transporting) subunit C [Alphaproteobacteria bacterium]|nr:NADH:ubiquinone reductase (Na(+)-transporting) subunit C [Alphaproteobacteria bacterium]
MADLNPLAWWRRFLALPNDSRVKTLGIALLVALVSATVVSVTAVTLKPLQLANLERQRQARMEAMIAALPGMADILREAGVTSLETRLVDLDTDSFSTDIDPINYDQRAAAFDPELSMALPSEVDVANIGRRASLALVYVLRRGKEIALIVLPVHGSGYQSTIYAYLALEGDLNKVAALTVYEQGETPGLGSQVEDPAWQALWPGKEIADATGAIRISVVRGQASGPHEVDGITGATRTMTGITNMLHFWLGDHGFGPFLARLRSGEISP